MQLQLNDLALPSWFQEMADCAKFTVVVKERNHRFVFVNKVFSHTVVVPVEMGSETVHREVQNLSETALTGLKSLPDIWQSDENAMASGLPSFSSNSSCDSGNGVKRQMLTSRFPLRNRTGNTSHLLCMSINDTHDSDFATLAFSQEKYLQVILECNPELSVGEYGRGRNGFYKVVTAEAFDDTENSSVEMSDRLVEAELSVRSYTDMHEKGDALKLLEREREQLARRYAIQSSLSAVVKEMECIREYVPLLQRIAEEVIVLLGADTTYLTIVDESQEFMEVVAVAGSDLSQIGFQIKYGQGVAGAAWLEDKIQVVPDYPKYINKITGFDAFKQVCVLPIKVHGKTTGVMGVVYESYSDGFLERAVEFEEFAQQVTIVVENAKLIENVRTELSRNQVLYKLSDALHTSKNVQTVLDCACEIVIHHCDTILVQIFRTNDDGSLYLSAMESVSTTKRPECGEKNTRQKLVDTSVNELLDHALMKKCLETQKPQSVSRLSTETEMCESVYRARAKHGIGSSICIPLVHDDVVWGGFVAHRDRSKPDYTDADINLFGAIGIQASVALNRQKLLSEIKFQAYHDNLTGLHNRLHFERKLNAAVKNGREKCSRVALLFIDLDGFKGVNDSYGHAVGDTLLIAISKRLLQLFDKGDVVARMGGDEFAVVLAGVESAHEVISVSEHAIRILSEECLIDSVSVRVGASVGISLFPDDSDDSGSMLKNADFAMYQAKSKGKSCAQYYDDLMARRFQIRTENEHDLANAIANNELKLVFQPKISLSSHRVMGVEALLRWEHSYRGCVLPEELIPIAEDAGLIIPIGDWVLKTACEQLSVWHQMGLNDLCISVNVSAQQFDTGCLFETVARVLQSAKFDPCFLDLELTESAMMADVKQSVTKLLKLKELGLSISIDDFGTGFSSLRYLEELPLDNLKIDPSFVKRLDASTPQYSLVSTIISMAEAFGLGTVAEGVETEEQLQKVAALGCDCIQGYIFSKPVEAADLPAAILTIEQEMSQLRFAA